MATSLSPCKPWCDPTGPACIYFLLVHTSVDPSRASPTLPAPQLNFMWGYLQVPDILHSDNGMEFCAEVVKGLCELWGVQQRHGSIGKPSTQGCVERINKTFKAKLSAQLMVSQGGLAWPFHVRGYAMVPWVCLCWAPPASLPAASCGRPD